MAHSNTSLNCFANCMARYKLSYVDHIQPDVPPSPHLTFGTMAHEVLHQAGLLRDEVDTHIVDEDAYYPIIPSEVLYPELKAHFKIPNWHNYFVPIVKEEAEIEKQLLSTFTDTDNITIERELKLSLTPEMCNDMLGTYDIKQPLVGIIDLLMYNKTEAIIVDFKFSTKRKTQDDFDLNSQLPLYALFVHKLFGVPLRNIRVGYIDIPKTPFDEPIVLTNGTLSRSKAQNVSADMYKQAVINKHGDDPYYNCNEGGYYYDTYRALALNRVCYLSMQYLDYDTYNNVTKDLLDTAKFIDTMDDNNLPYLKKYDSYSCKSCEYLNKCKPYLGLEDF